MLARSKPLEGPENPPFKQGGNAMYTRQLFAPSSRNTPMLISLIFQPTISPLAVTNNQGPFGNIGFHKVDNVGAGLIGKFSQPDSTHAITPNFSSDCHDILRLSPLVSWCKTTNQGLISLDIAEKQFASWSNHRMTQFLEHCPCGLIAGKPQQPLQPHRANAQLLVCHPPHSAEPQPQRYLASMEDGSGCNVCFCAATLTPEYSSTHPPSFSPVAMWANESVWPTDLLEVKPT